MLQVLCVDLRSETVAPSTGIAKGSKATASPGFTTKTGRKRCSSWKNDVIGRPEIDKVAKASGIYEATEFKANFKEDEDVTINYVATEGRYG